MLWAAASALVLALASCDSGFSQTGMRDFVSTGLSMVSIRSASFSSASGAGSIPSGTSIAGSLVLVNPKAFDVAYTLGWTSDASYFSAAPGTAPSPSDATHLSFDFALDPRKAEHKTITFTLGKYVASINKTYETESFSILCDSPPDPARRVATLVDANQRSVLAILLPTGVIDDDLSKVKLSWAKEGGGSAGEATYAIADLASPTASNPFSSKYDCYFQSSDCEAGYGYQYSVVVIDAAGQESAAASTSSAANVFYLNYDGNGSTSGSAPASVGYRYGATATVAALGDLAKADSVFYNWNSSSDGSGSAYSPGSSLTIPAGETTLYAQWYTNATSISLDLGARALSFSPSAVSASQGQVMTVSCANADLAASGGGWAWYIDGEYYFSASSIDIDTSAYSVGHHIVSCLVTYMGMTYSGSLRVAITQAAP